MSETISTVCLGLLLIVAAIALLNGRGSFLIAGFNTMSKEQQQKYDRIALCKFMGKVFLPIGILTLFLTVTETTWFPIAYSVIVLAIVLFSVIYANTGDRFKK